MADRWFFFSAQQLEKFSLPMCYCFQMECRRWAPIRRAAGSFLLPDSFRGFFAFSFGYLAWTVGLTGWAWLSELCRDAGMLPFNLITS
jgi:hypothetical protein